MDIYLKSLSNIVILILLFLILVPFSACTKTNIEVSSELFKTKDLSYQVSSLASMTDTEFEKYLENLKERAKSHQIDRIVRLPSQNCDVERCRFVELTLWMNNSSNSVMAPPVVRINSNHRGQKRGSISITSLDMPPHKRARLRVILELFADEKDLSLNISPSYFIEMKDEESSGKIKSKI